MPAMKTVCTHANKPLWAGQGPGTILGQVLFSLAGQIAWVLFEGEYYLRKYVTVYALMLDFK